MKTQTGSCKHEGDGETVEFTEGSVERLKRIPEAAEEKHRKTISK